MVVDTIPASSLKALTWISGWLTSTNRLIDLGSNISRPFNDEYLTDPNLGHYHSRCVHGVCRHLANVPSGRSSRRRKVAKIRPGPEPVFAYNGAVCRSRFSTLKVSLGIAEKASSRPSSPAANTWVRYEGWIAADPFKDGFRLPITGPHGFERTVTLAVDDDPAVIADRVRQTLEE